MAAVSPRCVHQRLCVCVLWRGALENETSTASVLTPAWARCSQSPPRDGKTAMHTEEGVCPWGSCRAVGASVCVLCVLCVCARSCVNMF